MPVTVSTHARRRRAISAGVAVAAVVAALVLAGWPPAARAFHGLGRQRTAGPTRVATAAAVARQAHPDGASRALVTAADGFADALAAAPLTRSPDGPLLLTHRDGLPSPTRQALVDLGVDEVTVVGGREAVSQDVAERLRGVVGSVTRVAGANRVATAAGIVDAVAAGAGRGIGELNDRRTAFLVNAWRPADAVAASAAAASAADPFPILLTEPDRLPQATAQALAELDITRVMIVGGTDAVSQGVQDRLAGEPLHVNTQRLAGPDRMATSAAVADFTRRQLTGRAEVLLARGDGFADALAAGTLGGLHQDPVLLTAGPDRLGQPAAQWLVDECPGLDAVRAIGGDRAVSDDVLAAAADCHQARDRRDYSVTPLEPLRGQPGDALPLDAALRLGRKFTGSVSIALLPCGAVAADELPLRVTDADGDGAADGLGTTDTGHARIATVEGGAVDETAVSGVTLTDDPNLDFAVTSDAPDCTTPVVFHDANGDGQLQVDAQGRPLEFYGWGHTSWSAR